MRATTVIAALALVGLLVVVAGGVLALTAIARHGERSAWVLGTSAVSLLALLVIVMQFAFDFRSLGCASVPE